MTTEANATPRLRIPGFGLQVDFLPIWQRGNGLTRLPHAISDWFASKGITLRERRMLEFIGKISDKPEWSKKVFDDTIIATWKEEAVRWVDDLSENGDWWLSEKMFEVCIQELQEKAKVYEETGMIAVLDAEATIVKSDRVVSATLRDQLRDAVRTLEDVPDRLKDWHPGSDEQVLDLVHPSLFPVVFGLTKVLPYGTVPLENCAHYIGEGETTDEFAATHHSRAVSWGNPQTVDDAWGSFQWLPSHIKIMDDGTPKIDSYINNLHPRKHEQLYPILERFVDAAIPLWNECISWYHDRIRIPIGATSNEDYSLPEDLKFPREQYREQALRDFTEPLDFERDEEDAMDDEEWAEQFYLYGEYREWKEERRVLDHPEPAYMPQAEMRNRAGAHPIDLKKDFSDRELQVIFKLANIHLTPEKPSYAGGSWHVEGSLNERICATALFYYDCENVTDSYLAFRQSFDTEEMAMKPAQSEFDSTLAYYGIYQDGDSIMNLGSVLTRQDRLLAFPNVLQHQVQPFKLIDDTKPGHRKILAMFLIDPHIPILSTANVPPQRKDWWAEEVRKIGPFAALPEELFEIIIDDVEGFPMSWEEACEVRERLMQERGAFNEEIEQRMEEETFSFCEH